MMLLLPARVPLNYVSLFSGIGGFDIGFDRAGMRCKMQVEFNEHASGVLAHHWPTVDRLKDVRDVRKDSFRAVDLICGGFPCQDVSVAGRRAGLAGERSGLWFEFARIIREIRPRWVVVENVAGLLSANSGRDFGYILRDLAASGYDAEWEVLSAAAFGAPHLRERVFIVAYPAGQRFDTPQIFKRADFQSFAKAQKGRWGARYTNGNDGSIRKIPDFEFLRMGDGIPNRLDRDRYSYLGNAIVPIVAEWIGRRIIEVDQSNIISDFNQIRSSDLAIVDKPMAIGTKNDPVFNRELAAI